WSWTHNRQRFLDVTEDILSSSYHSSLGLDLLLQLTEAINVDELMTTASSRPQLQRELVSTKPEMLSWSGVLRFNAQALSELLRTVPDVKLRDLELLRFLIHTSDRAVAQMLCERYPEEVLYAVCIEGRSDSQSN